VYCTGMFMLALSRHKLGVIVFSWTAGVMYSTLFTMPYLLVAHYHAENTVSKRQKRIFQLVLIKLHVTVQ
jgi:solute carrier family 45, member 1/2/4